MFQSSVHFFRPCRPCMFFLMTGIVEHANPAPDVQDFRSFFPDALRAPNHQRTGTLRSPSSGSNRPMINLARKIGSIARSAHAESHRGSARRLAAAKEASNRGRAASGRYEGGRIPGIDKKVAVAPGGRWPFSTAASAFSNGRWPFGPTAVVSSAGQRPFAAAAFVLTTGRQPVTAATLALSSGRWPFGATTPGRSRACRRQTPSSSASA